MSHTINGYIHDEGVIQEGCILLVHSKGVRQSTINWFQDSIYNHAGIFILIAGLLYVSEATENGIVHTRFTEYINSDKKLVVCYPYNVLTASEKTRMYTTHWEYQGKTPYGFNNLLTYQPIQFIAQKTIGRRIWLGRQYQANKPKNFICGQWVMFQWFVIRNYYSNIWPKGAPVDIWNDTFNFSFYEFN